MKMFDGFFHHRAFYHLPYWFHGLPDHLTFFVLLNGWICLHLFPPGPFGLNLHDVLGSVGSQSVFERIYNLCTSYRLLCISNVTNIKWAQTSWAKFSVWEPGSSVLPWAT